MKKWLFVIAFSILLVLVIPLSQGVTVESKTDLKPVGSVQGILCYIHSEGRLKDAENITCWKGIFYFDYNHLQLEYITGHTEIGFPFFFPIINVRVDEQRTLDVWFFKGNLTISGGYVTVDGFAVLAYCG